MKEIQVCRPRLGMNKRVPRLVLRACRRFCTISTIIDVSINEVTVAIGGIEKMLLILVIVPTFSRILGGLSRVPLSILSLCFVEPPSEVRLDLLFLCLFVKPLYLELHTGCNSRMACIQ